MLMDTDSIFSVRRTSDIQGVSESCVLCLLFHLDRVIKALVVFFMARLLFLICLLIPDPPASALRFQVSLPGTFHRVSLATRFISFSV